jgi:hypothetical protein
MKHKYLVLFLATLLSFFYENSLQAQVSCSSNVTTLCRGSAVSFTGNGGTGAVTYNWSFGDGASSTLKNPVHTLKKVVITMLISKRITATELFLEIHTVISQ